MSQAFAEFGDRLRQEREARALAIRDIARITKIPERSIESIETGHFDLLPGEVFVRGFLRSYARCVGLDPEETVRGYGMLVERSVADRWQQQAVTVGRGQASGGLASAALGSDAGRAGDDGSGACRESASRTASGTTSGTTAEGGTKRISVTLAVIVLVIVATLTISLLLRRQTFFGDGLSAAPPQQRSWEAEPGNLPRIDSEARRPPFEPGRGYPGRIERLS
ncbi:MAG: helix-turn-helix domain-containing protein [Pseudomonadota bacterium]